MTGEHAYQKKYIGPISFEDESFQRLYGGLSGAAQVVSRLNTGGESSSNGTRLMGMKARASFMAALMALRDDACALLKAFHQGEYAVHPLLLGQIQQIAGVANYSPILQNEGVANNSLTLQSEGVVNNSLTPDASQYGGRLASSYGNKKEVHML